MKHGPRFIDLTGKRFGKRLVIRFHSIRRSSGSVRAYWQTRCDCGTISVVSGSHLRAGRSPSCGCSLRENIAGNRYGRLVAVKYVKSIRGRALWEFACDCGAHIIARACSIKEEKRPNGRIKKSKRSCGCWSRELQVKAQTRHGHTGSSPVRKSATYSSWLSMKQRCLNPKATGYKHYGGRGLTI